MNLNQAYVTKIMRRLAKNETRLLEKEDNRSPMTHFYKERVKRDAKMLSRLLRDE